MTQVSLEKGITEVPFVVFIGNGSTGGSGIHCYVEKIMISVRCSSICKVVVAWDDDKVSQMEKYKNCDKPLDQIILGLQPTDERIKNGWFVSKAVPPDTQAEFCLDIGKMNCVDSAAFFISESTGTACLAASCSGEMGKASCVESKLATELDTHLSRKRKVGRR